MFYEIVDETRVILSPIEDADHDYINGSIIDVSKVIFIFNAVIIVMFSVSIIVLQWMDNYSKVRQITVVCNL